MNDVVKIVEDGNKILRKYDDNIWIPLSAFLKPGLTPAQFKRKWKYSIVADNRGEIKEYLLIKYSFCFVEF